MKDRNSTVNLSPIGNCATAALIDHEARIVWWCYPYLDGDPVFCRLLMDEQEDGFMDIVLDRFQRAEQRYRPNSAVLETTLWASDGSGIRVIDFAPRFIQHERSYRPPMLIRRIEPICGYPRLQVRIRPRFSWGAASPRKVMGSNHIRYVGDSETLRVTTNAPVAYVAREAAFVVTQPIVFVLGADEIFPADLEETSNRFEERTRSYWFQWCRNLSIPLEWQDAVLRSAITLKLSAYEETGAVVAAMTTSIPEAPHTERNWDYRACWLRDAFFVVRALNLLGATRTMEGFLGYMRNAFALSQDGWLKPVYGLVPSDDLDEVIVAALPGYRGMGPVRRGNAAHVQRQNDVFGAAIMANTQWFHDQRLPAIDKSALFQELERMGEKAVAVALEPDAGIWEYRGRARVHTHSALMCWASADRLRRIALTLRAEDRAAYWSGHADRIRTWIEERTWNAELGAFVESEGSQTLDASVLLMADLGFLPPTDPRFVSTVEAIGAGLMRGKYLLRYNHPDDFGEPETAFIVCTFWYVLALHAIGRTDDARAIFIDLLSRRNAAGLFSEDLDPATGELWGNYPQTYSLVGTILCAVALSRPWSEIA
ncbi:glycoside hydrolase family 15 protein [Hyphomicrobiaceae bacterium 22]|uniref:Glycoside hydrolase family 15 protein n=2 Tax=Prosthecodimorpha staleyi TaxID=2840188 RepID=A0A947DBE8_9HYPH|nr:glycoside hydrolase family 15 protein [Prosthecodimorpha staleyi]